MPILSTSAISKSYGAQDVLEGITCALAHGQRAALVGANGTGKTTLLRILAGLEEPSGGQVHRARGASIGYLPQRADEELAGSQTVHAEMLSVFTDLRAQAEELRRLEQTMAEPGQYEAVVERYGELLERFEHAGGYTYEQRIVQTLSALGFDPSELERPVCQLSGGQKTRVLLAKLVLQTPDVLLLDEPTNHLDVEAVEWLEATLRDFKGALIVVAHDRYFLDAVAQTVWELERGHMESYPGNYSQYTALRAERHAQRQLEYKRQQEYIAHQEDFIRRYMAGQKTRQAQGRLKRLQRLERAERPRDAKALGLRLQTELRSGDLVLYARELVIGYPGDEPLLACPWLELRRRQRVAFWGPNGTGKTTFLKTALGQVPPLGGEIEFGASVYVGYFAQVHEELDPARTILETILDVKNLPIEQARGLLGRYLFSGDEVFKPVGALSGGERARVALCVLTLQGANVLLLDEPSNYLDIASQEVLEEVLAEFGGTILMVSHDRYLVDRLATHVWAIEDRQVVVYEGGYSAWQERREAKKQAGKKGTGTIGRQEGKREAGDEREEWKKRRAEESRLARQQRHQAQHAAELEKAIAEKEARLQALSAALEQAGTAGLVERVQRLGTQYAQMEAELHAAIEEWERIAQSTET
ncbi:MAG: ATP-binding cassette domain-containing protein [Thermoflexales bacterium]|nr:ATP-binding cassette domain-containing protein [Thermoflexales bacterium]